MTIKIAIAGHTNVGKTTLIRTLMRMPIGRIGDAANITQVGEFYYYDGLQATFVDTPGFQDPSAILSHLKGIELDEDEQEDLRFDFAAMKTIQSCDAVIYVGNLSIVPDLTYKKEIEVVKTLQRRIIAVINQAHKQLKGSNVAIVKDRFHQWQAMCNKKGVEHVIMFDAHWDSRSKEEEIYDAISDVLPIRLRERFELGVEEFKDRQFKMQQAACGSVADTIQRLQKTMIELTKSQYEDNSKAAENNQKLQKEASEELGKCIQYLNSLYEVAAENPTSSTEEIITRTNSSVDYTSRVVAGAGTAGVLGVLGAVVGLVGGGMIGLLFGGVGVVGGAIGGAHYMGGAAALLGTTAALMDDGDRVEVYLDSAQIAEACQILLATLWGISFVGYGRGRKELSQREVKVVYPSIKRLAERSDIIDWTTAEHSQIKKFCMSTMNRLQDIEDWQTV